MSKKKTKAHDWINTFLDAADGFRDANGNYLQLEYLPFYINKFLADDNVEVMNTEQRGAYLMLLMRGWLQSPPASLPNDDTRLAKFVGLSNARWERIREIVMKPFTLGRDGRMYQKRLANVWLNSARTYRGRQRGADAANAKRKADAERDAERTDSVRIKPTQPNPPNPLTELNPLTQPTGGNGSGGGAGSVAARDGTGRVGGNLAHTMNDQERDFERMAAVQQRLDPLIFDKECVRKFVQRKDITIGRIEREIADIETDSKVTDVGGVLRKRLETSNGARR